MLRERINRAIEKYNKQCELKKLINEGQESVLTEEEFARLIMLNEISNDDEAKSTWQRIYKNRIQITDKIVEKIKSLGFSTENIKKTQISMAKANKCDGIEFSSQMIAREVAFDEKDKVTGHVISEYFITLYNLAVSLIQNGEVPNDEKEKVIAEVVESVVCTSIGSRVYLSGDIEGAKVLSSPELVASKEEIIEAIELVGKELLQVINGIFNDYYTFGNMDSLESLPEELYATRIELAALNVLRSNYGLEAVEPYSKDNPFILKAYEWAEEKAKKYRNEKKYQK